MYYSLFYLQWLPLCKYVIKYGPAADNTFTVCSCVSIAMFVKHQAAYNWSSESCPDRIPTRLDILFSTLKQATRKEIQYSPNCSTGCFDQFWTGVTIWNIQTANFNKYFGGKLRKYYVIKRTNVINVMCSISLVKWLWPLNEEDQSECLA